LFHNDQVLWPPEGEEGRVLEVGNYTFKFSFKLPEDVPLNYEELGVGATPFLENVVIPENSILPVTFGDEKSYIRYLAKAFVEIITEPVEGEDKKIIRFERIGPCKIVEQFDNEILIQPPKTVQKEKSFMFGGNNPIKVEFTVANGGVLFSGQRLYLHANVKNQCSRTVNGLYLRLEQIVIFNAHNEKNEEQTIDRRSTLINALVENSKLPPGGTYDQDLILEIPPFIPGSIRLGNFITRHYELNLDVELSMVGSMTLTHPLIILEWSPQLKGIVPDVVPVSIRTNVVNKDEEIKGEDNKGDEKKGLLDVNKQ